MVGFLILAAVLSGALGGALFGFWLASVMRAAGKPAPTPAGLAQRSLSTATLPHLPQYNSGLREECQHPYGFSCHLCMAAAAGGNSLPDTTAGIST
jgi:hypothetical protein